MAKRDRILVVDDDFDAIEFKWKTDEADWKLWRDSVMKVKPTKTKVKVKK